MSANSSWRAPGSTLALLRSHGFILNPWALGLTRVSDDFRTLPLPKNHSCAVSQWAMQFSNFFRTSTQTRSNIFRECYLLQQQDDPIYHCRSLQNDTQWRTSDKMKNFKEWSCEDADATRVREMWLSKCQKSSRDAALL